jgi:predicted  nucleic acid-binding Zn-ribbon protein
LIKLKFNPPSSSSQEVSGDPDDYYLLPPSHWNSIIHESLAHLRGLFLSITQEKKAKFSEAEKAISAHEEEFEQEREEWDQEREELEAKLKETESMLDAMIAKGFSGGGGTGGNDETTAIPKDVDESMVDSLERERKSIEAERKKLTETAVRLAKEKAELEVSF